MPLAPAARSLRARAGLLCACAHGHTRFSIHARTRRVRLCACARTLTTGRQSMLRARVRDTMRLTLCSKASRSTKKAGVSTSVRMLVPTAS